MNQPNDRQHWLDDKHLRYLRNEIDFPRLFTQLNWPWKRREDGVIVFVCPDCSEQHTSVNPRTNLARCFRCARNWNPIDFTMQALNTEFLIAVEYLDQFGIRRVTTN